MSAVKDLERIAYGLRELVLSRSTAYEMMDHISVKLPAPIFDQISMEVAQELRMSDAAVIFGMERAADHFTFAGVRFDRVDGQSWSVRARIA